jgi:hypothetical protein
MTVPELSGDHPLVAAGGHPVATGSRTGPDDPARLEPVARTTVPAQPESRGCRWRSARLVGSNFRIAPRRLGATVAPDRPPSRGLGDGRAARAPLVERPGPPPPRQRPRRAATSSAPQRRVASRGLRREVCPPLLLSRTSRGRNHSDARGASPVRRNWTEAGRGPAGMRYPRRPRWPSEAGGPGPGGSGISRHRAGLGVVTARPARSRRRPPAPQLRARGGASTGRQEAGNRMWR